MVPLRAFVRSAAVLRGPHARNALLWALVGLALLAIFGPALLEHHRQALEPGIFNNDTRQQIYPFFRYEDRSLFPADLAGDYYLAYLPLGYRALYTAAALGPGAEALSDTLPYLLLALTAAALAAAAFRVGGRLSAFTAAALCLGGGLFLIRMSGGLPRAFGFPIAACALAALVWGRSRVLAVVVIAGAAFYPVAAMPAGLALAGWMLLPARDRGDAKDWSFRRRAVLVAGTALASALLLAPSLVASRAYGPAIRAADLPEFPEAGPGGRYAGADRSPYPAFVPLLRRNLEKGLRGYGKPWSPAARSWRRSHPETARALLWSLLGVAALGWLRLVARRPAARRASLLAVAAFLGHGAASAVAPLLYLPQRYVLYPMLPFAVVLLAAGAAGLAPAARAGTRHRWLRPAAVGAFCAVVLILLGGRGSSYAGLDVRIDPDAGVYGFLRTLPPDALIAGWPKQVIDNVPYVSRRQALITYETHQAFHARYTLEMRRRMEALIDAYLATGREPGPELLRLHRELGVSHLLVDVPALRARSLRYFRPFDDDVARALEESRGRRLQLLVRRPEVTVFDDGRYRVLDLRRLAETARGRSAVADAARGGAVAGPATPAGERR